MSDKFYSWDDYIDLNERLVYAVAKSGWQFDTILCLSRGGMRPGDFFSRAIRLLRKFALLSSGTRRTRCSNPIGMSSISKTIPGFISRSNATMRSARKSFSSG